jgi:hypothetical protein
MFRDKVVLEALETLVPAAVLVVEEPETLETAATLAAVAGEVEHTRTLVSGEVNLANQLLLVEMVAVAVLQFGEILEEVVIMDLLDRQTQEMLVDQEDQEMLDLQDNQQQH